MIVDPATGVFGGYAWGENIGWIRFNCANTSSCGTADFKVKTTWACDPPPSVPSGSPALTMDESGSDTSLTWTLVAGATGSDIARGTLSALRSSGGDYSLATDECLAGKYTGTSLLFAGTPVSGDGFWFLVRGRNCAGGGSHDEGVASQSGSRDGEISASGTGCP